MLPTPRGNRLRAGTWLPVLAAGTVTALALVVPTLGGGETSAATRTAPAVVEPAARVIQDRSATLEHPTPAVPGWCRRAQACVDRRGDLAWLTRHGALLLGPVPVSLGGAGHRTPRGRFHVAWKAAHWTSTEYGLPMPYSVFFAAGGIAFHAGPLDTPSHGCVHLRRHDAAMFFDRLGVGDVVVVH